MTRKRTVRRVWDTKINTITHAMAKASITPREDLDKLLAKEIAAIEEISFGRGNLQHWFDLTNVVNICETLAHDKVGAEALQSCWDAQEALIEAAKRFQATGKMGLSGVGIKAVRDLIEYHDLQRSSIPRSQYEKAIRLTAARVKSGYATVDLGDLIQEKA